jgi:hypothetical protein
VSEADPQAAMEAGAAPLWSDAPQSPPPPPRKRKGRKVLGAVCVSLLIALTVGI